MNKISLSEYKNRDPDFSEKVRQTIETTKIRNHEYELFIQAIAAIERPVLQNTLEERQNHEINHQQPPPAFHKTVPKWVKHASLKDPLGLSAPRQHRGKNSKRLQQIARRRKIAEKKQAYKSSLTQMSL